MLFRFNSPGWIRLHSNWEVSEGFRAGMAASQRDAWMDKARNYRNAGFPDLVRSCVQFARERHHAFLDITRQLPVRK